MSQIIVEPQPPQQLPDDQISPKVVVMKAISIRDSIVRNWKLIILFCLLGYGIGFALDIYLKKPDDYTADVLFNLGSGSSSMPGGFGGMAGLLGLGGGAQDADIYSGENFFYFVESRPVVERSLMKKVAVGKDTVLLANLVIDSSAIHYEQWEDIPKRENFHFKGNDPKKYTLDERMALNDVVEAIKVATDVSQRDRKSSFITISVRVPSPLLAKFWAEILLETVEEVYTENQTSKTRRTLTLLENRRDSLARILNGTENRLARQMDYSANIMVPEGRAQVTKLQRSTTFITQLYAEAMTSVEAMKVSLVREAPLFTIIEPVKQPVDRSIDTAKRAQIGLLIGLVLSFLIIYFRSVYKTIMADPTV